jgi:hypothetical protein
LRDDDRHITEAGTLDLLMTDRHDGAAGGTAESSNAGGRFHACNRRSEERPVRVNRVGSSQWTDMSARAPIASIRPSGQIDEKGHVWTHAPQQMARSARAEITSEGWRAHVSTSGGRQARLTDVVMCRARGLGFDVDLDEVAASDRRGR